MRTIPLWLNNVHRKYFVKSLIICIFGFYGSVMFLKSLKFLREVKRLSILRNNRKRDKNEKTGRFGEYLTQINLSSEQIDEIVKMDIKQLNKYMKESNVNQENVLKAYQSRAYDVNSRINAVVDFLDVKPEGGKKGPLFGLPVSVKDNFNIKGYFSYVGCSYFLDKPANENSVLIDVIRDLGGVPFVKTNTPQTMLSFLSSNPVDGSTLNPHDTTRTSGGSSSGEAALIAAGGSIVGLGTDVGGSIRLPAAFCGVVGFKPCVGRLSKKGLLYVSHNPLVPSSIGIMGRDVAAVVHLFQNLVQSPLHRELDPEITPIVFNEADLEAGSKVTTPVQAGSGDVHAGEMLRVRIGYFVYDGSYRAVPAVERAVMEAVHLLEQCGYEMVPWRPPLLGEEWLRLFLSALCVEKGHDLLRLCGHDELDSSVRSLVTLFSMSRLRRLFLRTKSYLTNQRELAMWLDVTEPTDTAASVMMLRNRVQQLQQQLVADWRECGLQAVLCPGPAMAAVPLAGAGSMTGMLSYLNLWNLVDFPAGTVPVSRVSEADMTALHTDYPRTKSAWHANTYTSQLGSVGLPVGVQVVCAPWRDERCMGIMRHLEQSVHENVPRRQT